MSSFRDLVKQVNEQKKTVSTYGQKQSSENEEEKTSSFRDLVNKVNSGTIKVGSKLNSSQVNDWFSGVSKTGQNAYNYLKAEGYKTPDTSYLDEIDSFLSQANEIGQYIRSNRYAFDNYEKTYQSYVDTLNYLRSLRGGIEESNKIFSQYETEEEYTADVEAWENYYAKWGHYADEEDFDNTSANRNFTNPSDEDFSYYDAATDNHYFVFDTDAAGNRTAKDQFGNDLILVPNDEGAIKGGERYASPIEFDDKYKVNDPLGLFLSTDADTRDQIVHGGQQTGLKFETLKEGVTNHWEQLNDDEISMYYYVLNTQGKDMAMEYLRDTAEKLNARWGSLKAEEINNIDNGFEKFVITGLFGLHAGIDQWGSGVAQILNGQASPTSGMQYASSEIANSLDGLGKYAYQATVTVGNMLPSILISRSLGMSGLAAGDAGRKIVKGVGAITMGASAGGNAYGQALKEGYSEGQARTYGTLVGASEALLEYFIGGIMDLGGVGTEQLLRKASAIDKALIRIPLKFGIKIGSEITEEELQNYLEPAFRSIIFGADYKAPTFDEFVETAIVTALSTGFLEGGNTIVEDVAETQKYRDAGRTIMGAEGGVDALQALANEVAGVSEGKMQKSLTKQAGNVSGEIATGKNIVGKAVAAVKNNSNATKVGRLLNTVVDANNLSNASANQADIAKSLQRKGFNAETANDIAGALVASYNGQELTKAQEKLLKSAKDSKVVQEAISNIVTNEQSTVGQRSQNIRDFQEDIKLGAISRTFGISKDTLKEMAKGNLPTEEKTLPESHYEVSADGKTVLDGKEVELDGLREMEDGSIMVATADSQTADPGDVTYSSKGQALVYENYVNIETTTDNPVIANMDVADRSELAKVYDPASGVEAKVQFLGLNQAYWYGFEGITMDEKTLPKNSLVRSITAEQRAFAHELGRKAGEKAAKTQDTGMNAAYEAAVEKLGGKEAAAAVAKKNEGKVVLEDNIREASMTKKQRASYQMAEIVSKAVSTTIHVYHGVKEYGKYDSTTGEIWLNINGNFNGSSMMAFTLAHELVHMAKQWSGADFKSFADYLLEQYGKKGVSVERLIQEQMANAKLNGYTLNEHEAYEEVIADACMRMLLDSNALQKMAAYKEQNPGRWQQIIDAIKKFIDRIRKLFKGAEPDSTEAALYKELDDAVKNELEKRFVTMVMNAGEHMSTIRNAFGKGTVVEVNSDGEFTLAKGEVNGATKFLYNDYTWEKGGRDTLAAALKAEGFSKDDINAALTIMDGKHKLVKELAEQFPEQDRINQVTITTDLKDGHSVLSALVSNGDYPVNIDLLMVCKKRKAYQRVINRLCETGMIQQATVDALAIAEINKILGKYGFETACLGCFVESRRLRIQEWANTIVKEWNAEVKKRNPNAKAFGFGKGEAKLTQDEVMQLIGELESGGEKNDQGNLNLGQGSAVKRMGVLLDKVPSLRRTLSIEDLITPDGLSNLRKLDSNLFSMVKSRYGSNSPKFVQEFNPYNHELAKYGKVPSEYKNLREYLYAIGGARMQSFSDFIVENWFDYCQIVADLAARKLPMHTYTKEIALAKLFGLTGIKINMSLIPDIDRSLGKEFAGLTRNAKGELELIWADKDRFKTTGGKSYMQSINFADAIALQNDPRYSANVGTIAVGVSDKHILMMLDDARIRMVIPYHSSGMNPIFADLMGTSYYKDYTLFQNTTVKQLYNSKGQKVSLKLEKAQNDKLVSGFQFNEVLQELGDARAAAEAYKDWCADASKHTITIKGETYTAELTPKFNDFSGHENYYKLLEDFNTYDCISENAAPQGDVQQNYPEDFDKILKAELTSQENYRQKQEANQSFDKAMGEIESYLSEHTKADTVFYAEQHGVKLSAKDKKLGATDKAKLADLRKGMKNSLPKVDSEGRQLSEEQMEFFKNSVVRDAGGKLMVMYHGTANGGAFTIFDGDKLGNDTRTTQIGQGFYFTNVKKEAESYTKNVDIYGKVSRGRNPHLHQVYLNITNPFDITADKLDIEKVKAVYIDGTYDYFFDSWIPFYLDKKAVNGRVLTKSEAQAMSKSEKVSAYVDYLSGLGTKELLNNMVRAFPYRKQSDLLASMKKQLGYDGLVEEFKPGQFQYVAFSSEQVKAVDNKTPTTNKDIRYSMPKVPAPTFYSQMAKAVDGVKQDKLGAASVVSMLRGKGVKAEEIKWSGIEAWLEGKKSVTKAELQEFIAGSMLQIEEETLDYKDRPQPEELQKRLEEYERKREEVEKRVAAEWKNLTGKDFPHRNVGADLESAVTRAVLEENRDHKDASFEGRLLQGLS